MNKIWYTADTHFNHHNIIKYCKRPFQLSYEMNDAIIERWNEVVDKKDTVYHLGDVIFGKDLDLSRLNGTKFLLRGNHDKKNLAYLSNYFIVKDTDIYIDHTSKLVMCHYPLKDWPHKHYGYTHLHGHSHGTQDNYDINAVDVGVDCWDFYPVSLESIYSLIDRRKHGI
jgi:calcineurin-like phosphoesterase family protein